MRAQNDIALYMLRVGFNEESILHIACRMIFGKVHGRKNMPVIFYFRSVGKTGLLFDEQTPESLEACIQKFETEGVAYPPQQIREHSRSFSEQRFEDELRDYCTRRYADWQRELEACSHHETAKEAEE